MLLLLLTDGGPAPLVTSGPPALLRVRADPPVAVLRVRDAGPVAVLRVRKG